MPAAPPQPALVFFKARSAHAGQAKQRSNSDSGTGNASRKDMWLIIFILFAGAIVSSNGWTNLGVISLIVALVTLMTGVSLWFANRYSSERDKQDDRIQRVASEYLKIHKSLSGKGVFVNGLEVLRKAGATELRNRSEMDAVYRRILAKRLQHPNYTDNLPNSKVLAFLKFCQKHHHNIEDPVDASFTVAIFTKELPRTDQKQGFTKLLRGTLPRFGKALGRSRRDR